MPARQGHAIVFYHMHPDGHLTGKLDKTALHGGCDPLKAIAVLQEQLGPRTMQISDQKRGVIGLAGPRPVTDPDPIR